MISPANLDTMSEQLRVYDVDLQGWEHQSKGFGVNVRHVFTHLTKDLVGKDFSDEDLVRGAIAPDSIVYALRLSRWTNIDTDYVAKVTSKEEAIMDMAEMGLENLPWGFASFAGAVGLLATNLHDQDHEKTHQGAMLGAHNTMKSASRLLIHSAAIQSHQYGLSIMEAFDSRLTVLHDRFGIPKKSQVYGYLWPIYVCAATLTTNRAWFRMSVKQSTSRPGVISGGPSGKSPVVITSFVP